MLRITKGNQTMPAQVAWDNFRASKRWVADLHRETGCHFEQNQAGFIYQLGPKNIGYIEDHGEGCHNKLNVKGRYLTDIVGLEYWSDDIVLVERKLFDAMMNEAEY